MKTKPKIWNNMEDRLCLRIEGIPAKENETSNNVLDIVKEKMAEAEVDIPDNGVGSCPSDWSSLPRKRWHCDVSKHHGTLYYVSDTEHYFLKIGRSYKAQ